MAKEKELTLCPRCNNRCEITRHHVFPKRWREIWTGKQRRERLLVCRKCHDAIEEGIALRERARRGPLKPVEYVELAGLSITKAA